MLQSDAGVQSCGKDKDDGSGSPEPEARIRAHGESREGPQCRRGVWQVALSLVVEQSEGLEPAHTCCLQVTLEASTEKRTSATEQWLWTAVAGGHVD